jgi:hypothetical protein
MEDLGLRDPYDMTFKMPNIRFSHKLDSRQRFTVETFVPLLPNSYYRPKISPEGMKLWIYLRVPNFFVAKNRQLKAFRGEANFNDNTHLNTAYGTVADKILEDFDNGGEEDDSLIIWNPEPMEVDLPFKCEEEIAWEVQLFPNNLGELTDECGGQQFHGLLICQCTSVEKPRARARGGRRVVTDEDEDAEMGGDDDGGDT